MRDALLAGLPDLGLTLEEGQVDALCAFGEALLEKNQVMNLTAITDPEAVARLHFLDSLTLLDAAELRGKAVIDVGCGAGFPGVPLKIAEPSVQLTLLDPLRKRMAWLSETLPALGVEANCVTARAEDYVREQREAFDVVVSRAVARLDMLLELCLPLVKPGGLFLAMKGTDAQAEAAQAANALELLGGRISEIRAYAIAGTRHRVVVVEKTGPTSEKYPRRFAKIKQRPL